MDGSNGTALPDYPAETVAAVAQAQTISADEIALYDRQIRLWGVKAQEKLRTASILLITIKALANEIAKNLVLAGIGSITVVDHEVVTAEDLSSQFFVTEEEIGKNRAEAVAPQIQKLNPRVNVAVDTEDIRLKQPEFFMPYDVIIATELDLDTLRSINDFARLANRPFYAAGSHGMFGFIFADLVLHEFVIEREKSNVPTELKAETSTRTVVASSTKKENGKLIEMVTKQERYTPLALANAAPLPPEYFNSRRRLRQITPLLTGMRALWEFQHTQGRMPTHALPDLQLFTRIAHEKHQELQIPMEVLRSEFLRGFLGNLGSEIPPVTAFLGGQLAQDVINVLGQREQPIQNLLLFDGEETTAPVYAMHPIIPLEALTNPALLS